MENNIPSVIILSGGKSLRMQHPKAFLKIDDKTLVEHLVNVYIEFGIVEPIVILNKTLFTGEWMNIITKLYQKAKIGFNQYTVLGRTYSIQMGLDGLEYAEDCFIQNIDNPDISVQQGHRKGLFQCVDLSHVSAKLRHHLLFFRNLLLHVRQLGSKARLLLKDGLKE